MNKKLKKFIQFFIALIIVFLTTGNANAAIRYDFDRELFSFAAKFCKTL